jgi:hypothetical protein
VPKVLYLSDRELAIVINALDLFAAEPDTPPPHVRDSAERHGADILAGYAHRVAADTTDAYDADHLRDQWFAHTRPDLQATPTPYSPCSNTEQ